MSSRGVDPGQLGPPVRRGPAVVNPILVVALARSIGGQPIGERRIVLGSVAYAIPYVAMWSLVGVALGGAVLTRLGRAAQNSG